MRGFSTGLWGLSQRFMEAGGDAAREDVCRDMEKALDNRWRIVGVRTDENGFIHISAEEIL